MKRLVILGAGGNSKVIADMIQDRIELCGEDLKVIGVLDDNPEKKIMGAYPVVGPISEIDKMKENKDIYFINGIGDNETRKKIFKMYQGIPFYTVIHPSAIVGSRVMIGEGSIIMPGVIINADSKIGDGVILNSGSIVEHDNKIEDFAHLASGVATAGNVSVGEGTLLGTGAKVIPGISIGRDVVIGAGAVVVHDIPNFAVAVGMPARVIKYRQLII